MNERIQEIAHELEQYGMKCMVFTDYVIASKKRPTFTIEMKVTPNEGENKYIYELLILSIDVEIKQYSTKFEYHMGGGYEKVRLDYPRGEITGSAKGLVRYMYLSYDTMRKILTSSKELYAFIRQQSSFDELLPENYL